MGGGSLVISKIPQRMRDKFKKHRSGCWLWFGARNADGYGQTKWKGKQCGAHRVIKELVSGPLDGMCDHLCRVRNCVNPEHIELVTPKENSQRGYFAMRTHCKNGHEFCEENIIMRGGTRICIECRRNRDRYWKRVYRKRDPEKYRRYMSEYYKKRRALGDR